MTGLMCGRLYMGWSRRYWS